LHRADTLTLGGQIQLVDKLSDTSLPFGQTQGAIEGIPVSGDHKGGSPNAFAARRLIALSAILSHELQVSLTEESGSLR
tara:strand:- start:3547 stop:3783 length:237 start_codon:yes stop_codon:yes gene_type:complete